MVGAARIIVGFTGTAACVGILWAMSRSFAGLELAIDEAFGDWPAVPDGMAAPGYRGGGGATVRTPPSTQYTPDPTHGAGGIAS